MTLLRLRRFWAFAIPLHLLGRCVLCLHRGRTPIAAQSFGISTAELGSSSEISHHHRLHGEHLRFDARPRYDVTAMMLAGRLVACGGLAAGLAILLSGHLHIAHYFGAAIFVGIGSSLTMPSASAGALSA